MGSFEERLQGQLAKKYEEAAARRRAAEMEAQARAEFLLGFRGLADTVVKPVFERAAAALDRAYPCACVDVSTEDEVSLHVIVQREGPPTGLSGRPKYPATTSELTLRANASRRRVVCSPGSDLGVGLEALTEKAVQEVVHEFVESLPPLARYRSGSP